MSIQDKAFRDKNLKTSVILFGICRLTVTAAHSLLCFLQLTVNFFLQRLTDVFEIYFLLFENLKINFHCCKELKVNFHCCKTYF